MGAASTTARDPVCGMQVDPKSAKFSAQYQGQTIFFCSQGCVTAFQGNPAKFMGDGYKPSMLGAMLERVRGLFSGKHP